MHTRSEVIFDVPEREKRVGELNHRRLDPDFWSDPQRAAAVEKEISVEQDIMQELAQLRRFAQELRRESGMHEQLASEELARRRAVMFSTCDTQ